MARAGSKKGRGSEGPGNSANENVMPDVYREMLVEAVSSSPSKFNEEEKPVKRRRIGGRMVEHGHDDTAHYQSDQAFIEPNETDIEQSTLKSKARQQTAFTESDDSADSDVDWEEVDLKDTYKDDLSEEGIPPNQELNLVLGGDSHDNRRPPAPRRKPASAPEKKLRLEIHKMHLLSLLVHIHRRNHWCNDEDTHRVLRKLLDKRMKSFLNPDSQQSQFQRSRSLVDGLTQALEIFKDKFKITARGMSRSYWADSPEDLANMSLPEDLDFLLQKSDFRETAKSLSASRDVGAQLFCALLRSAGVDARLVCSLQALPFATVARGTTPQKSIPMRIIADPERQTATSGDESGVDVQSDGSVSVPRAVRSVGGRNRFASTSSGNLEININNISTSTLARPRPKPKRIRESPYPIYWVEAFDEANQKWIPVDPLITKSVAKPSKLEPPASDPENQLNYVVAFEDDGSARDVTRRYAKAYNAKTRRDRVEFTKGGEKWWRKVMRVYRRDHMLDRDQVEDAQLAQKEAREGMPKSVQDFKDHPYYALERHMRRSEVIHPKREVGKVAAGRSGGDKVLEPIYRHRDVHEVKSADKWYRLGREIETGEQPLKRVAARRKRESVFDEDQMSEDEDNAGTGLYAAFQTTVYNAPPVVNGRIPKNIYGNLDVYVPSMVPAGGAHITHPETVRAARILGIDYAEAVTGFAFKGRHGTAIITGAVVATGYREAVEEVTSAFEDERIQGEEARRSAEALRMWRRFLAGLRIRERIEGYEVEGERDVVRERTEEVDAGVDDDDAGGFLPDRDAEGVAEPTAGRVFIHNLTVPEADEGGGFMNDKEEQGGGFLDDNSEQGDGFINDHKEQSGGFLPNDEAKSRELNIFSNHQPDTVPFAKTVQNDNRGGSYVSSSDEDAEEALRGMYEQESCSAPNAATEEQRRLWPQVELPKIIDLNATAQTPPPEQAGGFLLDNDDEPTILTSRQSEQGPHPTTLNPPPQNQEMPQELCLTPNNQPPSSPPPPILPALPSPQNTNLPDHPTKPLDAKHSPSPSNIGIGENKQEDEMEEELGMESDPGSLLSRDPEDEDADPEWLA